MKFYPIVIFILLALSNLAFAQDRRDQLLDVISEEISEVNRLARQSDYKNPVLQLRLAELFLEKARLVKEEENQKFLSIPPNERSKIDKKRFFQKSTKLFVNAGKICQVLVKRHKNFSKIADAYFILAYNAKEFDKNKQAEAHFRKALNKSKKGSKIFNNSSLALAEILYNKGKYREAIKHYEISLADKGSRWWTKDALNLAWCYSKVGEHEKSISIAREVLSLSSQSNYVDMRGSVLRDIALFYAQAGKISEGVGFYKSVGEDISSRLIKLARYLIDEGKQTNAEQVLREAKKVASNDSEMAQVNLILMGLYEKYGNFEKHVDVVKDLVMIHKRSPLDSAEIDLVKFQAQKVGAILQRQVVGKTYVGVAGVREKKAKLATEYFQVIAELEQKSSQEVQFLKGETFFSIGKYEEAMQSYSLAYEGAKAQNDGKYIKLTLEASLAALGKDWVNDATKGKYLTNTYIRYLNHFPREKSSHQIFQKLFKIHLDSKNIKEAEGVLTAFRKAWPEDVKVQEAMVANVIDYHRSTKNVAEIRNWAKRIQNKEFVISPGQAKKLRALLLTMQFEGAEKATTKGQKKFALKEYFRIFKAPESSKAAKKNAAYNIAVLFYELENMEKTYEWAMGALQIMDSNDVKKFDSSFLAISSTLFEKRQFEKSWKLSRAVISKICQEQSVRTKIFFKNASIILLAENNLDEAESLLSDAQRCNIPPAFIQETQLDLLKAQAEQNRWNSYLKTVEKLSETHAMMPLLIKPLFTLRGSLLKHGENVLARKLEAKMMSFYEESKRKKEPIPLEGLDVIAHYRLIELEQEIRKLNEANLEFPEEKFNAALKFKLQQLDKITSMAQQVLEVGSGIGIVKSYQYLVESYQRLVKEIRDFKPEGKSPEYIDSFQKSMVSLTEPILKKSYDFIREAREQITKNSILSHDNYWFFSDQRLPFKVQYRYVRDGVLMDRGGKI